MRTERHGILQRVGMLVSPAPVQVNTARYGTSLLDAPEANDHFGGIALAGANEYRARQPLQIRCCGFKRGNRPEVDKLRIDRLALEQLLHDCRRRVTHAGVLHIDQLTLIRLERVARVELTES